MPFCCETLSEKLKIWVSREHKFGTDAFLLSDFAHVRRKDLCCDLCSGCGIVAFLWHRGEDGPRKAWCVEIQPQAVEQMKQTVTDNGLHDRVFPLRGDLREVEKLLPKASLDLVTCNPPYKAQGHGILSEAASDQIARHELFCSTQDVCEAAAKLLRFGGRFCLCQRPERLADVLGAMRSAGLEPKRLRFVQQRPDTAPWLFLAEGKKGAKPFLQVEPPLIIEGTNGFSEEVLRIYQKGE